MLEIVKDPNPILREIAKPIDSGIYIEELIDEMVETMEDAEGIGLAAPQVGVSLRLFIIKDEDGVIRHYINPEILDKGVETIVYDEGCLSIDNVTAPVERPKIIKVKWWDLEVNEHVEELDGYMSRVFQHEFDHLEGILFTDYLV